MHKGVRHKGGKRNTLAVTLSEDENRIIDGAMEEMGMAKVVLVQRLVQWFARQSDTVKKIVLGVHPKDIHHTLAAVLRQMADHLEEGGADEQDPAPTTPEEPKKRTEMASVKRRGDKAAQVVTIPGSAR